MMKVCNMDILIYLIVNALEIIGVQEAIKTKHFKGFFTWVNGWMPDILWSPLFGCHKCMSSIHGFLVFLLWDIGWIFFPLYILALCGTVSLISKLR